MPVRPRSCSSIRRPPKPLTRRQPNRRPPSRTATPTVTPTIRNRRSIRRSHSRIRPAPWRPQPRQPPPTRACPIPARCTRPRCTTRPPIRPTTTRHIRARSCATRRPRTSPTSRARSTSHRIPAILPPIRRVRRRRAPIAVIPTTSTRVRRRRTSSTNSSSRPRRPSHPDRYRVRRNSSRPPAVQEQREPQEQEHPLAASWYRPTSNSNSTSTWSTIPGHPATTPATVPAEERPPVSATRAACKDRIWSIHRSVPAQCLNRVQKTSILGLILVATSSATSTRAAARTAAAAAAAICC